MALFQTFYGTNNHLSLFRNAEIRSQAAELLGSAYFPRRGCVKLARADSGRREVGFAQPFREKFALLSTLLDTGHAIFFCVLSLFSLYAKRRIE